MAEGGSGPAVASPPQGREFARQTASVPGAAPARGATDLVVWLTPKCNLKCGYCFQTCGPAALTGAHDGRRPDARASRDTILAIADFVRRSGIKHVEFFGGEPLYYRKLFEFAVRTLHEQCPRVSLGLVTNGTMLNETIMSLIEEFSIAVLLSLDGGREGHNRFRGRYDRIAPWFERLQKRRVAVACQAGAIDGLYDNVRAIWQSGFPGVFINVIENFGWYSDADVARFESEYEEAILGMLRGEGELNCAKRIHTALKASAFSRECGIIRKGLGCDWEGNLFPCHRAIELGPDYAIGTVHGGLDAVREKAVRTGIEDTAFNSPAGAKHPEVSFCAVSMVQNAERDEPNPQFCAMIETKHKLVAKHYYALEALDARPAAAAP